VGEKFAKGTVVAVSGINNTADKGGFAAVVDAAVLNVASGTFAHNSVGRDGKGGLLYAIDIAVVNLRDCRVSGFTQELGVYGGAFNIGDEVRLTLSACTIADYRADRGGGLAAYGNSSAHVQNCIWRNLTADRYGGGAFLASKAHITMRGGRFVHTHAQYGGAINTLSGGLDMADVVFENATSSFGGGAMYAEQGAVVNLTTCRFNSCSSDSDGGALHILNKAQVRLLGCNITRCTAAGAGGAVQVAGNATVDMDRCSLQQNHAETLGGAVALDDAALMHAKHSSFVENVCAQKGGGLYATKASEVHFQHCIVARNEANAGGGLYLYDKPTLRLESTPVADNIAAEYGGGVVLGSSVFSMAALRAAVRNNQAPVDADISALATGMAMRNSSAVHGFVSRMRSDEGLWNATLLVTGPQALPSSEMTVVAWLDGAPLTKNKSGEDGLVHLHIKLRKPPGEPGTGAARLCTYLENMSHGTVCSCNSHWHRLCHGCQN
jgi:predicted outer membrane repeat protein